MAAELAAGYVSLTVKLAKGGMADVTKEVAKQGKEGGKVYSDEFGKQVEKDVGKKLPDTISKSTKGSGGIIKAAKEAADEFGKGFREGIEQALGKGSTASGGEFVKGLRDGVKQAIEEHGGIASSLDVLSDKIKDVTTDIGGIGDAFGVGTTGIKSASKTVTEAIDGISTSVTATTEAMDAFKSHDVVGGLQGAADALRGLESVGLPTGVAEAVQRIGDNAAETRTKVDSVTGPLQELTSLAGPDSKLYKAGQKLPIIGQFVELAAAAQDVNGQVEQMVKNLTGLDVKLSPITIAQNEISRLTSDSAADQARAALNAARAAASNAAGPAYQDPKHHGPGRAGGGGISGPGGPKSDIIPIWASSGEHVLSAADVAKMGGQAGVYKFRSMLQGFSVGGAIDFAASVGDGRPYLYGGIGPRYDCSGYMSAIYAAMLDKPQGTRYFTTESDFKALGFLPGNMPGQFNIGIKRGGGGRNSHMAGTLPDGTHVESGGSHGSTLFGSGAAGAEGFPLKFYLPVSGGDPGGMTGGGAGRAGGSGGGGGGGGGLGPSGTFQPGSNPYAQLASAEKQKQEAIANIFGPKEIGTLGDIGMTGLKETLLPPGFSDPTTWKSVASAGALLKSIGILSGDPQTASIMGSVGGLITGQGSAITGLIPQPFGTLPMPGPQPAPGVPGFPGQPAGGGVSIGTFNDNSGKGLETANKETKFNTSPNTKQLTRRVG